MPDDEALRRAIDRQREDQVINSMIAQAQGDLLGWACRSIAFWRELYYRQHSRYDNLRRLSWLCFAVAAGEAVALIVIYATWGHS